MVCCGPIHVVLLPEASIDWLPERFSLASAVMVIPAYAPFAYQLDTPSSKPGFNTMLEHEPNVGGGVGGVGDLVGGGKEGDWVGGGVVGAAVGFDVSRQSFVPETQHWSYDTWSYPDGQTSGSTKVGLAAQ